MDDQGDEPETREDLIAFARAHGYDVEDRLARWHRAWLLPRPTQRSKGKAQGTVSLYPAGTHRQLLTLLRIHEDEGEKRFAYVAWRLWWEGFDVSMDAIRSFLAQAAQTTETTRLPRWSEKFLTFTETARLPAPMGQLRRHLRGDFPTLIRLVLGVAHGGFRDFSDQDEKLVVERALGIPEQEALVRLIRQQPGPRRTRDMLMLISRAIGTKALSRAARDSRDEELLDARRELRDLFGMMDTFGEATAWMYQEKAFPYALLRRLIQAMRPRMQASILLLFIAVRQGDPAMKEGMVELLAMREEWDHGYRSWQLLQAMRQEIPVTANTLSPDRFRATIRDPEKMRQLQDEIRSLRAAHLDEFEAFFVRHRVDEGAAQSGGN